MINRNGAIFTTFIALLLCTSIPVVGADDLNELIRLQEQVRKYQADRRYRQAIPLAKEMVARAERSFQKQPQVIVSALTDLANLYFDLEEYSEAAPLYEKSLKLEEKLYGPEHPDVAGSVKNLASLLAEQSKFDLAESHYKRALRIYEKVYGSQHSDVAEVLNQLGILYEDQEKYSEAETYYKRALKIREKNPGPDHLDLARSLNNLAILYKEQGDLASAAPLYQRSLKIRERVLRADDPRLAVALNNLATLFDDQGKHSLAEPLYRQALQIFESAYGPSHPEVAMSLNNLAMLYWTQRKYVSAEPLFQRSLKIYETVRGPEHPDVAMCLNNLANLYADRGRYNEAEPLYRRSLTIREKVYGPEDSRVAACLYNLAHLNESRGNLADAEPLYRQALRIREKVFGPNHRDVASSLNGLAVLYIGQEKYAEAETLINRAIRIRESTDTSPGDRSRSYRNRAEIAWKQKRHEQALEDLQTSMQLAEQQRIQVAGAERDRAQSFMDFASTFETMVDWQTTLGDFRAAFTAAERKRARSLQDQMALGQVDLLAGLPPAEASRLRRQEREANTRVASLQTQLTMLPQRKDLTDAAQRERRSEMENQLKAARADVVAAYRDIRTASPAYHLALGQNREAVSADEAQSWLAQSDGWLLEYLLGAKGGYLFSVPAEGLPQVFRLNVDASQAAALGIDAGPLTSARLGAALFTEEKSGVLDLLRDPRRAEDANSRLAVLWQVLIPEPFRQSITDGSVKRLLVVPDGPLTLLPFETLVVSGNQSPQYLLDVGPPIQYGPSASVLYNLGTRTTSRPGRRSPVLTVADPAYQSSGSGQVTEADNSALEQLTARSRYGSVGGSLQRLPYSATESRWVAEVFGKNGQRVGQLLGKSATEAQVRFNVSDRRFIHLACHGLVDQEFGNFFGALALTPGTRSGDDASNDGYLTLPEIYELNLTGCDLAILSACNTNYGPRQQGEGVWALSRGFLVAGSKRVVASNWLVNDEAAASLISYFSGGLTVAEKKQRAVDYAGSLHAAKKWVRAQKKWQSPHYWGTFVLVGPE